MSVDLSSQQVSVWEILDYQGRSVTKLAELTGFPRWYVNDVKRGRREPNEEFKAECAKVLGVPVHRLSFFGSDCVCAQTLDSHETEPTPSA